jgi:hypothetical protein
MLSRRLSIWVRRGLRPLFGVAAILGARLPLHA